MYPHYNREARDLLIYFMNHYFPDREQLVWPIKPLHYFSDEASFDHAFDGLEYKEGYKLLNSRVRALGENIPPLINTYIDRHTSELQSLMRISYAVFCLKKKIKLPKYTHANH